MEQCPEADPPLCATDPFPPHLHDQDLWWGRGTSTVAVGTGEGWQLALSAGLDLKLTTIDYTTLDGAPYDPPYGNLHHRDEVLFGLADGRLVARKDAPFGRSNLGLTMGTSLPLGKTEEDPWALTDQGLEHQHFQRGTGSFVPTVGLDFGVSAAPVGLWTWAEGRVPLYANGKGYLPGPSVTGGVGPVLTVGKPLRIVLGAEGVVEGRDRWSGELAPGSGRLTAVASATALAQLSPATLLLGTTRATLFQQSLAEDEDQVTQRVVLGFGVSYTPPGAGSR